MAENSRIEDLRKRYHENPRRFFAPLANEYRKAGFLDRALLLCQKHVPEQPDNMNGLVVYGQILFESGNTADARDPFERALKVDPENLIALRHLGDIARIGGDVPEAKQWYERVLELDRRNDEVLDLMQQMGLGDAPAEVPAMRPSTAAGGLVSVASSVSVSSGADVGMIDLDMPAAAPVAAAKPAGPGRTLVINAQALADRDRRDADAASASTLAVEAVRAPAASAPTAEAPAARPSRRASLLDIDFEFSETGDVAEKAAAAAPPVKSAEGAEYGIADDSAQSAATLSMDAVSDSLIVETIGDMAPLGLEPTIVDAPPTPEPALPAEEFELADFSAEVSPLAGLEATEFTSDVVQPLPELDNDTASATLPPVSALEGLDRPDVEPGTVEPLSGIVDLPLLDEPVSMSEASTQEVSTRPRPRMTKANMSSLPLIADFGLEDDEPPASKPTPIVTPAVTAKSTPTFVTETMAALYVQQGHIAEAVEVYRQLVVQSPNDSGLRAKLTELERMQQADVAPIARVADVEMPEFEDPIDTREPEPAAANAAMAGVSFGGIGLKGQGSPTPVLTPAVPAGPSAREFFGGFARRAAVAVAVVAVAVASDHSDAHAEPITAVTTNVSAWPLDSLFGAAHDVRDLHAAEVLAGVATFGGPDGGTGLEALFTVQAPPARRAVPRASEMLKFDQFFQAPGTAAPVAAEPPLDASAPAPGEDDDLDQFHGWLKGLKK
jgi:tetratricopeptide (TPR) repeat protein